MAPLLGQDGAEQSSLTILRDCTERHRTEAALARLQQLSAMREAEAKRRAEERDRIWQLSPDLLMVARPDARLVAVNPA
jgi:hypothetical protein